MGHTVKYAKANKHITSEDAKPLESLLRKLTQEIGAPYFISLNYVTDEFFISVYNKEGNLSEKYIGKDIKSLLANMQISK